MPTSDFIVLLGVAIGTPAAAVLLRRRGVRGRRLFITTWLAFFGLVLLLIMTTAGTRREAVRATSIVLAVTAPLIPSHTFFGVLLTALSVLTLATLTLVSDRRTASS